MDLTRLREQTVGSDGNEEAVTVNTRALIDKVLARYSSDWTTLRELIQNAADAQATKVSIRFGTLPSRTVPVPPGSDEATLLRHTLQNHTIYRVVVSNNGESFSTDDWARLKRIAEGNPDETKIGAFGVGFYSVFADCEEPFVISGSKTMAFLWKGNSLYTKSGTVPSDQEPIDTTFLLNYRSTNSPLPDLMSICQFLSTSLTFVGLETIELWLDQWNILTLNKKLAPGSDARLPQGIKTTTKEKMMKVVGVVHQSAQIDAKWLNAVAWNLRGSSSDVVPQEDEASVPSLRSLFSRFTTAGSSLHQSARKTREAEAEAQRVVREHVAEHSTSTVFLRVSTINIQTYVASNFAKELERATKKPPPKHTRIAILTSGFEETNVSSTTSSGITSKKSKDIFHQVLPTKNGRIFIGFPTAQTTGLLCHVSAPSVIPTVERESIDLNARYVKTWNIEMLRVAGIACRIAYMSEMDEMKKEIARAVAARKENSVSRKDAEAMVPHAAHIFNQYNARESTPSTLVGEIIEEAFWECSTNAYIDVLSTSGVLASNRVRVVAEPLSFLENIPIVPPTLATAAEQFIQKLYTRGLISDMSIKDIRTELEARSLNEAQFTEFLKWSSQQLKNSELDPNTIQSLLDSAVFSLDEKSGAGRIIALSQIKTFVGGTKIPPDMPLPLSTIPFRFSKAIPRVHLEGFGWEELQLVPWIQFLLDGAASGELSQEHDIQKSSGFAAAVLTVISKQWDSLAQNSRSTIVETFNDKTVIPTKLGMRRPTQSYFASVKLFDDLPTIEGIHGVKEKVLTALGVRKTIELNYVFDRLMSRFSKTSEKENTTWSFVDLVQYLTSVRNDIPSKDIERLRSAAICPSEEWSGSSRQPSSRLYKISELFEPKEAIRDMGLPVLYWPGTYRHTSLEGKFLSFLGLKQYPSMLELIRVMTEAASANDQKKYDLTIRYFQENYIANNYVRTDLSQIRSLPFLPVEGIPFPTLLSPAACYQNERGAIMGYPILRHDLKQFAMRFGVSPDPPIQDAVARLIKSPPTSSRTAMEIFGYFAGRLAELNGQLADTVGNAQIVPIVKKSEKQTVRLTSPRNCFLGDPSTYGEILDFVDFGPEANSFLHRVGSKEEPNSVELAQMVVESPARIIGVLGDKKYLELLRKIAESANRLKTEKTLWKELKSQPCLLAYKESFAESSKHKIQADLISLDDDLDDEDVTIRHSLLRKASDIVIQDAVREYHVFRDVLATAPQDDVLESFYQSLGVPLLSSLVRKETSRGNVRRDQSEALKMRKHIVERSRLFLYEHGQDIRHDAKWLDKYLSVVSVDSITMTQTLQGYPVRPFREKRTAAVDVKGKEVTLYTVRDPDLYEVAYWIAGLLLNRLKQNDALALEMVLSSDLRRLRSKGYNVDRILRQKEYETKLAEEERKKQAAEEEKRKAEQRQLAEQEKQLPLGPPPPYEVATPARARPQSIEGQQPTPNGPRMPGEFFDSPQDQEKHQSSALPPPTGNSLQELMSSAPEWARNIGDRLRGGVGIATQPATPPTVADPANSERNVTQNLTNAVNACRSHNSNSVFNRPSTTNVAEAKGSYCDSTPAQDLVLVGDTGAGIKFYMGRNAAQRAEFLATQSGGLNTFGHLLLDVASIFGLRAQSLHTFFDDGGPTIAFNERGALFFNYHWFLALHLPHFAASRDRRVDALAYWWITMCHELAHNLVKEHSAAHSYYCESFAQQYFGRVMAKCLQY